MKRFRTLATMAATFTPGTTRKRRSISSARPARKVTAKRDGGWGLVFGILALVLGTAIVYGAFSFHATYTVGIQSPLALRFSWPIVVARRTETPDARAAQMDQRHALTAYQQYACSKFGPACRVALAIQRAENPQGNCELYHYNSDGTLDWGYFQINTVHLQRRDVVLRNLLDCRANIDFAYLLYTESHGFTPWSTYKSGAYRKFLRQ